MLKIKIRHVVVLFHKDYEYFNLSRVAKTENICKNELSYYTEAFSQEEKRSDGFGLGLYIVKTIANLHGYKLEHKYEGGRNYFIINMMK